MTATVTPNLLDLLTSALDTIATLADTAERLTAQVAELQTQLASAKLECERTSEALTDLEALHDHAIADKLKAADATDALAFAIGKLPATPQRNGLLLDCDVITRALNELGDTIGSAGKQQEAAAHEVAVTSEAVTDCDRAAALVADHVAELGRELASVNASLESACNVASGEASGAIRLPEPMPAAAQVTIPHTEEPPTAADPGSEPTADQPENDTITPESAPGEAVPDPLPPADIVPDAPVVFLPDPTATPESDTPAPRRRRKVNAGAKAAGLLLAAPDAEEAVQALVDALRAAGRFDLIETLARVTLEAIPNSAA